MELHSLLQVVGDRSSGVAISVDHITENEQSKYDEVGWVLAFIMIITAVFPRTDKPPSECKGR